MSSSFCPWCRLLATPHPRLCVGCLTCSLCSFSCFPPYVIQEDGAIWVPLLPYLPRAWCEPSSSSFHPTPRYFIIWRHGIVVSIHSILGIMFAHYYWTVRKHFYLLMQIFHFIIHFSRFLFAYCKQTLGQRWFMMSVLLAYWAISVR